MAAVPLLWIGRFGWVLVRRVGLVIALRGVLVQLRRACALEFVFQHCSVVTVLCCWVVGAQVRFSRCCQRKPSRFTVVGYNCGLTIHSSRTRFVASFKCIVVPLQQLTGWHVAGRLNSSVRRLKSCESRAAHWCGRIAACGSAVQATRALLARWRRARFRDCFVGPTRARCCLSLR